MLEISGNVYFQIFRWVHEKRLTMVNLVPFTQEYLSENAGNVAQGIQKFSWGNNSTQHGVCNIP